MSTPTLAIEPWQVVWRQAVAPRLERWHLQALARGLRGDDPRLQQGVITLPVAVSALLDRPCEGGCALTYPAFATNPGATAGEVSLWFERLCQGADLHPFIAWFDGGERAEVFRLLLAEVERSLAERG